MLKRKFAIIAVLFAVFVAALGIHAAASLQPAMQSAITVPADPIPLPIAPPPV